MQVRNRFLIYSVLSVGIWNSRYWIFASLWSQTYFFYNFRIYFYQLIGGLNLPSWPITSPAPGELFSKAFFKSSYIVPYCSLNWDLCCSGKLINKALYACAYMPLAAYLSAYVKLSSCLFHIHTLSHQWIVDLGLCLSA